MNYTPVLDLIWGCTITTALAVALAAFNDWLIEKGIPLPLWRKVAKAIGINVPIIYWTWYVYQPWYYVVAYWMIFSIVFDATLNLFRGKHWLHLSATTSWIIERPFARFGIYGAIGYLIIRLFIFGLIIQY